MNLRDSEKQLLLEIFNTSTAPDVDGEESYEKALAEAAELFGVEKATYHHLKAFLLFGKDALLIKDEIAILGE